MTTPNGTTDPRWTALCEQIAQIADPHDRDRAGDALMEAYLLGIECGTARGWREATNETGSSLNSKIWRCPVDEDTAGALAERLHRLADDRESAPDTPTRGTESPQPAEQDPDAHTDGPDTQEPTQADRIIAIVAAAGLHLAYRDTNHTGKGRDGHLNAADVDEVVAEAIDQIKILTGGAVSIGSLAARKNGQVDQGLLNLVGRVLARCNEPGTDHEAWKLADRVRRDLLPVLEDAQRDREVAVEMAVEVGRLRALLVGRSDHDVVSVELLRKVLGDGPGPVGLIDVDDLATLRRKAAMLPVVLLWRDHTANALSALVAAVDERPYAGQALLSVAAAHAREVLTVDPEKAYGFAGPVEDVIELDWLRRELAAMREAHDGACQTIAAMHAAAVGEVRGPIRGVVEDVADLRAELAEVRRIGQDRLRAFDRAERESRDLRAKLTATEAGLDEAVRYATTLEETVAELRQHPARLVEMPATGLDVGQQIRLETARLLMEDWHSIAAGEGEALEDATIGGFVRDMLRLATAIETGAEPAPNQDGDGAADGEVR